MKAIFNGIRRGVGVITHAPSKYRGTYSVNPSLIKSREDHIKDLKNNEYDVVIIGGGASGAGLVLECATRGLKAALVEGEDFAVGTSSRSTKLIHGGIRYLEAAFKKGDFSQLKLVFEGLRERSHVLAAGGNLLSNSIGLIMPIESAFGTVETMIGVKFYDFLAKIGTSPDVPSVPNSALLRQRLSQHLMPSLRPYKASLLFHDGAHIDQRTVLHLLTSASLSDFVPNMVPASVANYCRVTSMNKDDKGVVKSIRINDSISGTEFDVKGSIFVNCAGPFSDEVRKLNKDDGLEYMNTSSGIHLTFPKRILNEFGGNTGIIIPKTSRGSVCFMTPYQDRVIVGTTDIKEKAVYNPLVTKQETDYICEEIAPFMNCNPDSLKGSILSSWKGFRPLVKIPSKDAGDVGSAVRSHLINKEGPNLYSLMGGKWTSYREMGQDTVDSILNCRRGLFNRRIKSAIKYDGERAAELNKKASTSRSYGMCWAAATPTFTLKNTHYKSIENHQQIGGFAGLLCRQFGLSPETATRFTSNYGYFSWDLLHTGLVNKTNSPIRNVNMPADFFRSEIEWLCDKEQARHVDDIIARRLSLAYLDVESASSSVEDCAKIMADKLGWSAGTMKKEIERAHNLIDEFRPPMAEQ